MSGRVRLGGDGRSQRGLGGGGLDRTRLNGGSSFPPRGPARVFRAVVYAALLIAAQGALSRLADAWGVAAPDLFLLTAVALAWRLPPAQALLAAYGVGLGQDLLGGGVLGLHAAGLAGAALWVVIFRRSISDSGPLQNVVAVTGAVIGQWLTFGVLAYWLKSDLISVRLLAGTVPVLLLGTLLLSPLWDWAVRWGLGPRPGPQENLV
ncbi:rod shape-determining protein MreD [Deinococcus arenicola]|uniref:Rod shape-determining protein MreD n=1 Tax=Deinococcus arenicola TaxID=2994950 RepID=A0ABU4DQK1_9DEIO|nr:rod shape-determining protein MreD [Deinococcus sp. ZS9-10]MDV6374653.1 rod shape-determining protein MreD [Deinococcus sp. ZS9-10]